MPDQPLSEAPTAPIQPSLPFGHQTTPADRVDPHVRLPPSVVAAGKAADAAYQAAYGGGEPGAHAAAPANQASPLLADGATSPPTDGTAPQSNGPIEEPLPETNPDGSINWENRYKALKGRQANEQKRYRETLSEFEARQRELTQKLEQAGRPPLPGELQMPPQLTPQEVQEYGADLIDVIKRAATEAVVPLLAPLATEVGHMRARVDVTQSESEKQFLARMHGDMDRRVPGWEEMNRDPNFVAWTKKNDIYSGLNRQELLQKAWFAGDSHRVAAFFQGFLAEEAATDPAAAEARQRALGAYGGHASLASNGTGQPAPTAQPQAAPRVTLEQLAAPGRARAAASTPAGKPVWTAEGISQFYVDCAKGKFVGREAERAATELDLMNAQREGRIVVNPRTATTLTGH
jgi:hypothetical protein